MLRGGGTAWLSSGTWYLDSTLADLAGNKEFARELLDFIIKKNMTMLENIISCPNIDGVLLGSDWGS